VLAAAVRTYGSLATEFDAPGHERLRAELERHLTAAREKQDRHSELLDTDQPDGRSRPRRSRLRPPPHVARRGCRPPGSG
jgi:hypothetical protein